MSHFHTNSRKYYFKRTKNASKNLLLFQGLQGGPVSPLLAGNERFRDVSGPLDLTGSDKHLKTGRMQISENLNPSAENLSALMVYYILTPQAGQI